MRLRPRRISIGKKKLRSFDDLAAYAWDEVN